MKSATRMGAGGHKRTRAMVDAMETRDFRSGSTKRPTEQECWENFWWEIGQIAHRIWLDDHPASRSSFPLSEGLVEDAL